jgi:hypothetical protein
MDELRRLREEKTSLEEEVKRWEDLGRRFFNSLSGVKDMVFLTSYRYGANSSPVYLFEAYVQEKELSRKEKLEKEKIIKIVKEYLEERKESNEPETILPAEAS